MHLEVQSYFIEALENILFFLDKISEFTEAIKLGKDKEFLDNNPDFFQMVMMLSQSRRLKWWSDIV